jgi:carnitine O-acetyltransferase
VLSASNRDVWAKVGFIALTHIPSLPMPSVQDYDELRSSPQNAQIIDAIHSAAFTVSLDPGSPTQSVPFSRALWHGGLAPSKGTIILFYNNPILILLKDTKSGKVPVGLRNRWVDKPVQFIVFDNAQAGLMGEHSVMDGTPTARLCDDILDFIHDPSFDHGSPPSSPPAKPTPMDWYISPNTAKAISIADEAAVALIESQEMYFHLTNYGKAAIKKFGVSPDSWTQMIIQLAYSRLLASRGKQRVGGTYEAATTRRFYKGRTEAIRVVSVESDKWVASMDDENIGIVQRKKLFGEAVKKHLALAKNSGAGLGVDRLLFGAPY